MSNIGASSTCTKVDGTQLAAGCFDHQVFVWRYPSGEYIMFETEPQLSNNLKKRGYAEFLQLSWNPVNPDVLATFKRVNVVRIIGKN